jgi:hypothetical protein
VVRVGPRRRGRRRRQPARTPIYVVCKGSCLEVWERRHRDVVWANMDVECLPVYLAQNLGLNWEEASARAAFFANYYPEALIVPRAQGIG